MDFKTRNSHFKEPLLFYAIARLTMEAIFMKIDGEALKETERSTNVLTWERCMVGCQEKSYGRL